MTASSTELSTELARLRYRASSKTSRSRASKNWRNLETVKTLASRLQSTPCMSTSVTASHERLASGTSLASSRESITSNIHKNVKKAQTVGAQFQHSLQSLMVALNKANPFFVRCIKSNRLKVFKQLILNPQLSKKKGGGQDSIMILKIKF